jgi:DNA polymerase elongation subunit (family B)
LFEKVIIGSENYSGTGIHSDDKPKLFKETDLQYIIDADIGSMYPTLLINHQLCPEHLSNKFIQKYTDVRNERLRAKHNNEKDKAEGLKTVLNSTWGKYNNENFWLYDPLQAYRITVNGQLYIMMLIEDLMLKEFEVISCNTDGITTIVKKDQSNLYYNICRNWEIKTKFELEYNYYTLYSRRDVNNYICQYNNNKLKEKGDFITTNLTKTNNTKLKGVDRKIIAIALREFFINNVSIQNTILNHQNIYDFCTSQRTDDKFINEYHYLKNNEKIIEKLQKTIRYYISKSGGTLFKVDPKENKYINYCVNRQVTIFNQYIKKDIKDYNIDYGYYISETQKIIDQIIPKQLKLWI